jgi:hypothetical protein
MAGKRNGTAKGKKNCENATNVIKFSITVPKECVPMHGRKEKWNGKREEELRERDEERVCLLALIA